MDATLESLALLNDPSRVTKIRGVPIFRAHNRKRIDPHTGQEVEVVVNDADLSEIVRNMQTSEEIYGVCGRVIEGHIIPDAAGQKFPEHLQPKKLYGFFQQPRVGPFGPKGIAAVLVDYAIFNEHLEELKSRPYRSAEYYPGRKTIKGVGSLIRDPELDMGILTYGNEQVLYYSMDNWLPETPVNHCGSMNMADELTPAELQVFQSLCGKAHKSGKLQQYIGAAFPGALNTTTIHASGDVPELYQKQLGERDSKIQILEKAVLDMTNSGIKKECEALVDKLQKVELYKLDRDTEILDMIKLPDEAARQKRADYIREHYQSDPTPRDRVQIYSGPSEGQSGMVTQEIMDKAITYMGQHPGTEWDKAIAAVKVRQTA